MSAMEEAISPQVRTMQIIVGAMIMGTLILMIIVTTVLKNDQPPIIPGDNQEAAEVAVNDSQPILSYVGCAMGAGALVMAFVLGPLVAKQALQQVPTPIEENLHKTLTAYQTGMIISAALCEGAAFLNLIAYMIEDQFICVAIAIILLFALASYLPTTSRVANWIEDATRLRREQESFGN